MPNISQKNGRLFQGVVVSTAMSKTIVVRVDRIKMHPKYKKRYTSSSRYLVHDEKGEYKVGDHVQFQETRPISRHKRWRAVKKI